LVKKNFFEGNNPLKRVVSPQTPLFPNFLTKNSSQSIPFYKRVYSDYCWELKFFGKRGVIGEREPFFKKGFLSPKILLLNQMIKSWGISGIKRNLLT